eukprot:1113225_1
MALQNRKHQEDEDLSPFYQLQKSQVLHESKVFSETPLDSRKCCSVLTELLCLLSQGEVLGKAEATTLFFGVTKLFQSQDPQLRRLVYLVIKELNKNQDDAFIVISSLEKDINGGIELFRANALRVHSQVIDSSMLEQRARLFRQAIVSKSDHISSSALCAGIRMYSKNQDVVKRWQNETREATKSPSKMVSFHALHLLYKMHCNDRRAVMRLVSSMINRPPESALARCLLIRYAFSCIAHSGNISMDSNSGQILEFIKDQIKQYKNPMVMFEAAKCLCHLPDTTEQDLTIAMNVLQEFLNSPRPIQRFAAVRALSSIVNKFNNILSPSCTVDLEHLITDGNRNIATLAITTLLQTAAEYSIERLLSSITEFMTEIADELKIVLVGAIEAVCAKFPAKFECLLNFLSMALREEGGYTFKNKIVDCMLLLMTSAPRAKEFGLDSLCEFIEDCEYPLLSVRILYVIGELGPSTPFPSRYIRFIYNRVLLELPCVRAAAVSCLTKCAVQQPVLKNDIHQLLQRSLHDEDDEVRDRATLYCALLDNFVEVAIETNDREIDEADYVDVAAAAAADSADDDDDKDEEKEEIKVTAAAAAAEVRYEVPQEVANVIQIKAVFECNLEDLESSLLVYLNDNTEKEENEDETAFSSAFGSADIDKYLDEKKAMGEGPSPIRPKNPDNPSDVTTDIVNIYPSAGEEWDRWLQSKQADLPELGVEICSSAPESLTEPEAEYQAEVIKRIYSAFIVLQFNIQQTIEGQLITDVYVDVDYDDNPIIDVTCPVIACNGDSGIAVAIIERGEEEDDEYYMFGKYECVLKFNVKDDVGEDTKYDEGYEDDYTLNEIVMHHYDYIYAARGDDILSTRLLKEKWNQIGKDNEQRKKGTLTHTNGNLQEAVTSIVRYVGLTPVEDSHKCDPDDAASVHALNLIAYTDKKQPMCMRCHFIKNDDNVSYKAAVRCENELLRVECAQSF